MTTFTSTRTIPATPADIFEAIKDPTRLARWWGPAGFTNRFEIFEFVVGGKWIFEMISPDGQVYPNQSVFVVIEENQQVTLQHICQPYFTLTMILEATAEGTLLHWEQVLEDEKFAEAMRSIIEPANEQNLDRLTAEVCRSGLV